MNEPINFRPAVPTARDHYWTNSIVAERAEIADICGVDGITIYKREIKIAYAAEHEAVVSFHHGVLPNSSEYDAVVAQYNIPITVNGIVVATHGASHSFQRQVFDRELTRLWDQCPT